MYKKLQLLIIIVLLLSSCWNQENDKTNNFEVSSWVTQNNILPDNKNQDTIDLDIKNTISQVNNSENITNPLVEQLKIVWLIEQAKENQTDLFNLDCSIYYNSSDINTCFQEKYYVMKFFNKTCDVFSNQNEINLCEYKSFMEKNDRSLDDCQNFKWEYIIDCEREFFDKIVETKNKDNCSWFSDLKTKNICISIFKTFTK